MRAEAPEFIPGQFCSSSESHNHQNITTHIGSRNQNQSEEKITSLNSIQNNNHGKQKRKHKRNNNNNNKIGNVYHQYNEKLEGKDGNSNRKQTKKSFQKGSKGAKVEKDDSCRTSNKVKIKYSSNINHNKPRSKQHRQQPQGQEVDEKIPNKSTSQRRRRRKPKIKDDVGFEKSKEETSFPFLLENNDSFPTLTPLNDELDNTKYIPDDLTKTNSDGVHLWSNVAHMAHEKSVRQQIEEQKERERLQYEIDTFTNMEILRPYSDNRDSIAINNSNDIHIEKIKDVNDQGSMEYQSDKLDYYVGWTNKKFLNANKLKERWLRALQEKQLREEQEILKSEKIESNLIQNNDIDDESISLSDTSTSTFQSSSSIEYKNNDDESSISSNSSTSSLLYTYLERQYPLHSAIINNDESVLRDLLLLPPDVTSRDQKVEVKTLQDITRDPNLLSLLNEDTRLSILHLAVLLPRPNILRILLSMGRKYNLEFVTSTLTIDDVKNDLKCTALMIACQFNLEACVKVLMNHGPRMNVRHPHSGDSALHIACRYSHPSTVQLLLSSSSQNATAHQRIICKQNRKGETPFHICCSLGRKDVVEVLLQSSTASCIAKALEVEDNKGYTPLLSAIYGGDTNLVLHLLSWRSNIRSSEVLPKTCLSIAVATKSLEMVSLLVDCLDTTKYYDFNDALFHALDIFDDSSVDGIEIIKILVEAGADPFRSFTTFLVQLDDENSLNCTSSLTFAVYKGQVQFVACMLDTFLATLKRFQEERRMDRVLLKRPDSYFQMKEKEENDRVQKASQDALLAGLLLYKANNGGDEVLSMRRMGCCLSILRRGIRINKDIVIQLLKRTAYESHVQLLNMSNTCLEASYVHPVFRGNNSSYSHNRLSYDRSNASEWSKVSLTLGWIWKDDSCGDIICPWIQSQRKESKNSGIHQIHDEECHLIVGSNTLLAHKSILSSKSSKLEAAIRFAEMNGEDSEDVRTTIPLNIPFDLLTLFTQHCYHGSMACGLSTDKSLCCQQLLDLYFLAQEYICPSLLLECEMRLLSKDPLRCVCWYCCDKVEFDIEKKSALCSYLMHGPSKLMTGDNLLGITANLEDWIQDQNCYTIRLYNFEGMELMSKGVLLLLILVHMTIIFDFVEVLRSDSYLDVFHSTMNEFPHNEYSDHLERYGDEIGVLLLQNCIDVLTETVIYH